MNPRHSDHRDLKLAPDGARTTIASGLPCYLVPSSRIRLLETSVAAPLHPALSLAYRLMLLMVAPLEYPMSVSIHLCIGLPLLLAPFILPSVTSSSIPPALTQWRIVGSRGPGARNSVGPSAMGETQRLPAGALEAPWSQTHFGNNMKIG